MFWFGHGLGYGTWEYGSALVTGKTVSVEVTNTSSVHSREVVQVYFDPEHADQPVRLVGWATVDVAAGETAFVNVVCDGRMWRTWDTESSAWHPLDGGELIIARGLGDVRNRLRSVTR